MIPVLFNTLLFLIPLVFFKNTSELFEFNKIIVLYIFTTLIIATWIIKSIIAKKIIFRRTLLDWPLVIYLSIYLFSSLLSIDPRTSWLGYYSRFNGGLASQICYALLYWAFVSNMTAKQSLFAIRYSLFAVTIASLLAIFEHFGIFTTCGLMGFWYTESCWVQDVQNRVFSTLGQPNWLAAILVALLPISNFQFLISNQFSNFQFPISKIFWFLVSILFFLTLLFTKSRSGLLAFGVESLIFWGYIFWKEKFKYLKEFLAILFTSIVLFFVFQKPITYNQSPTTYQSNSLETGGTESGTIRKYVWIGAINIFKNYPILGSGPETFAFVFPKYKPIEHNLTSEWDFIYNKAHNEFLNILANTGILGFFSYIFLIWSIFKLFNQNLKITNNLAFSIYHLALMSGFASILITNFFGFSVVPVSLLFFLFPAIGIANSDQRIAYSKDAKLNLNQKIMIVFLVLSATYTLFAITYYWQADIHYNKAKTTKNLDEINKAIAISPNEPLYIAELALAKSDVDLAIKALDLNPYNQNIRNILISNLNINSKNNKEYLFVAEQVAETGTLFTPMNPKIFYQLGILNLKNDKIEEGIKNFEKSIELKPNYKEARFALGLIYIDIKNYEKAKENLEYILNNISPDDELTKKYLEQAKSASE